MRRCPVDLPATPSELPRGFEPYCPFTSNACPGGLWSALAMGIKEARAIVRRSGTEGTHVVFKYPPALWHEPGGELGGYLVDLLGKLGYAVRIERHRPPEPAMIDDGLGGSGPRRRIAHIPERLVERGAAVVKRVDPEAERAWTHIVVSALGRS
jgi:hypothetical protein